MNLKEEYDKWCKNIDNWDKRERILILIVYSVLIFTIMLLPIYLIVIILGCVIVIISYIAFKESLLKRQIESIINEIIEEKEEVIEG